VRNAIGKTLIIAVLLALVGTGSAQAGKYHVYSCRTPAGEAAPVDGWTGSTAGTGVHAENTCASGGSLLAGLSGDFARTANTSFATWALEVPSAEKLTAATLWRAGDTAGGEALYAIYAYWFAGPSETSVFAECVADSCLSQGNQSDPLASENKIEVPSEHIGAHLYMRASCGGLAEYNCPTSSGDEHGYDSVVHLYAANLVLEQAEGPTVKEVTGPMTTESPLHGTTNVEFQATDPGAGVYQAIITVDGSVVQESVVNENSGHCHNVGETTDGLPAFLYLQPCLKSVEPDIELNTTKLSNGIHHIVVSVTDPAGNSTVVLNREVEVFNPGAPPAFFWRASSAELVSGATREVTVKADGSLLFNLNRVGKKKVEIESSVVKLSSGAHLLGGKPGALTGKLTLEGLTVTAPNPKKCEVVGGKITTPTLTGTLVEGVSGLGPEGNDKDELLLTPAEGTTFATMEFAGSGCDVKGDTATLEGGIVASIGPNHEETETNSLTFVAEPSWLFRNSKGELKETSLNVGRYDAWIEGELQATLTSKEHFGAF
jgi:hypothetical protein